MKKVKALSHGNKLMLIIGSVAILLIILLWSVLANIYNPQLHEAPSLTPLSNLNFVEGPRFVHPSEPVTNIIDQKINEPTKSVKTIDTIKVMEEIPTVTTKSR